MTDGSAVRTFWSGVLHAIGAFDLSALTDAEKVDIAGRTTWFWLGEVSMAGVLAGIIAVPAGIWFAGRAELSLAFIGAADKESLTRIKHLAAAYGRDKWQQYWLQERRAL